MRARTVIFVLLLASPWSGRPAAGQEEEVRQAVSETLAAWRSGDFEQFGTFYHADTRGFFLDGGALLEGFNVEALQAVYNTGFRADLELGEMSVKVLGNVALTAALLQGGLTLPDGSNVPGTWRYSDTRVLEEGTWKIVQYHFSEMEAPEGR